MPSPILERQQKLSQILIDNHLDALALNPGPNLVHLTGLNFHLMERPTVAFFRPEAAPLLILPELEQGKLAQLPFELQPFPYTEDRATWPQAFRRAVDTGGLRAKRVGIIPNRLRVLELRFLEEAAPQATFVPAEEVAAALRMRKDPQEIEHMRQAAHIAQEALEATLSQFKIGITEREFAAELTTQLLRHGSDPHLPFSPIVASGPHSANPHATPTARTITEGDLLLVDWGANVEGYFSDITRTFAVGDVGDSLREIAGIVKEANAAGRAAARAGTPAGEVDQAARTVISRAGYGEHFIHRTGHGLGREAHEEPYIAAGSDQILEVGMTFTIEPGIYLPRVGSVRGGGVRIEDDVVITPEGCESLTDLPREMRRCDVETPRRDVSTSPPKGR
ncbi:MAG: Xaa-Pro dipeptidase [Chloroflexi bacterium]|nr:Xaa-Pro dipeptidase [Chloroflexota bacterium]